MKKVDPFLSHEWAERELIDGRSFNDLFQIDGVPLWWLINRIFVPHMLPKQINAFNYIETRKNLSFIDKIKFTLLSLILKNMLFLREMHKIKKYNIPPKNVPSDERKKILLLTYTNHILPDENIFRTQSIIDEIKKSPDIESFLLFADPLSSRGSKKLFMHNSIYNYYSHDIHKKAAATSKELYQKWASLKKEKKKLMMKVEGGGSLWPYLKYPLNLFFSRKILFLIVLYYEMAVQALAQEKIKLILLTSQNSIFEKCMVAAGSKISLPILRVQHGIGEDIVPPSAYDLSLKNYYKLVFSDNVREQAIQSGWGERNVAVVGPVIFDEICRFITKKEKANNHILIATAPLITECNGEKNYFSKIKKIIDQIAKIRDVHIDIKLHPSENKSLIPYYEKCFHDLGIKNFQIHHPEIPRTQFYSLIQQSDVFVHFGSTSALEAMIIGRPIVTIKVIYAPNMTDWVESLSITVSYKDDIKSAILKSLKIDKSLDKRRKEFIKQRCGVLDGKASIRVADIIKKLVYSA